MVRCVIVNKRAISDILTCSPIAGMIVALLAAATLGTGCSGNRDAELKRLEEEQAALAARLERLEAQNRTLITRLNDVKAGAAARQVEGEPAPEGRLVSQVLTTNVISALPTNMASVLASQINALLAQRVDSKIEQQIEKRIEQQIASRIGSPDEIEAIFSEAVEEGFEQREEQERRERIQQNAERDEREVRRRAEEAQLDEERQDAIVEAMRDMRVRLREQLPELDAQNASLEEKLAVAAESRKEFEAALAETLSDEELLSYYAADPWVQRQVTRVGEISTAASLDQEQTALVDAAYQDMRELISDGFLLRSEGHLGRGDMRETFTSSRANFDASMQSVMTAGQYEAYRASEAGRGGDGRRGPPFWGGGPGGAP